MLKNNLLNQVATMGPAGFGNPNNVYTWSMATCRSNLYVGTYNTGMPNTKAALLQLLANPTGPAACSYGGDLYRLSSSLASRFVPVTSNGMGDVVTYGFRTMVTDSNTVYIGTANPRNLLANPTNGLPWGGWELLALTHRQGAPFDMDGDLEADAAWATTNSMFVVIHTKTVAVETNYAGSGAAVSYTHLTLPTIYSV